MMMDGTTKTSQWWPASAQYVQVGQVVSDTCKQGTMLYTWVYNSVVVFAQPTEMYVKYVQHNKISNKLLVSRFQPTIENTCTRRVRQ